MNSFSVWIIDPYVKVVGIVELSRSHILQDMYRLIGCSAVNAGRYPGLAGDDMLFFDEDAFLAPIPKFSISGHHLVGRVLVVGTDYIGNKKSPETTVSRLIKMVAWP